MKKVLALLLAVSASASIGVTAFANDNNDITVPMDDAAAISSSSASSSSTPSSSTTSSSTSSSSTPDASAPSTSAPSSSTPDVAVAPSGLVFGADADTGAVLGDDILEPGTEYKFPVSVIVGDKTVPVDDELLKTHKFSYTKISSNGITNFEIEEYKGTYYLYVETRETTPNKPIDVKYTIKLSEKSNNHKVFSQEVKFQYGYDDSDNDYINGLDEGDVVEIDNARPIITASQFNKIAKLNNYKNVTLAGSDWEFTVNVTDESTKNMVSNNAGVKAILSEFPDQDFRFYNFPGRPSFAATGRVELDVDDIVDDFSKMYTYRYADGKLYKLNASFDGEENIMSFRTNKLDTFVITNKAIKDGYVVTEGDKENNGSDDETENGGATTDKENPGTGASDMIHVAVMAGIAALSGAGVAAVKKAK